MIGICGRIPYPVQPTCIPELRHAVLGENADAGVAAGVRIGQLQSLIVVFHVAVVVYYGDWTRGHSYVARRTHGLHSHQ